MLRMSSEDRLQVGIEGASAEDIRDIIRAALVLERDLYAKRSTKESLFRLRKSLEAIWGHDLPEVEL